MFLINFVYLIIDPLCLVTFTLYDRTCSAFTKVYHICYHYLKFNFCDLPGKGGGGYKWRRLVGEGLVG